MIATLAIRAFLPSRRRSMTMLLLLDVGGRGGPKFRIFPYIRTKRPLKPNEELFISYDGGSPKVIEYASKAYDIMRQKLLLLNHCARCNLSDCKVSQCERFKILLRKVRQREWDSSSSHGIWHLLRIHANNCRLTTPCPVPHCDWLKQRIKK